MLFQAQNRETKNSSCKAAVSSKIIMTTNVTRLCFTTQHKTCKTKTKTRQWLKWFCEAGGGAHLTKPVWSKTHTHSNPTNLALFRHKITLYRFNQGLILLRGCSNWSRGLSPPPPSPLTLTTGTRACKTKTNTIFLISDRSCPTVSDHITEFHAVNHVFTLTSVTKN